MEQKLTIVNDWTLNKLLVELESGQVKIPKFQRDYIWEKSKVVMLLNSIYHQYPIGSFFFWLAPQEYESFVRDHQDLGFKTNHHSGTFQFILDGQQRMISLYVALRGKIFEDTDYSTLCFNPEKCEFKIPRNLREKNNIPAWKLMDEVANQEVYNELLAIDNKFNKKNNRLSENWKQCHEIFTSYPVSIVKTQNEELEDVVEIFERINQGGKHLTIFDLIHATTWSEEFDLKEKIKEFNEQKGHHHFGDLSNKIFTNALTLNAFDDARNIYQLRLTPELCNNIWPRTKAALNASLDFFKHMRITGDISAYHNLMPVIQYYFFKGKKTEIDENHIKLIEKWFWDAKFSKRYSTSIYTRIKEDANWIAELVG